MAGNEFEYYRPSGAMPPKAWLQGLAGATVGALVGGWVYSLGVAFNPIFYFGLDFLRILFVLGVLWNVGAMAVGWFFFFMFLLGGLSHCRSGAKGGLVALVGAVLFLGSAYHFWLSTHGLPAPWAPGELWTAITEAAGRDHPVYQLSRRGRTYSLDGIFLWGPWVVEALGVVLFTWMIGAEQGGNTPYCEACAVALEKDTVRVNPTQAIDQEARFEILERAKARDFAPLLEVAAEAKDEGKLKVILESCTQCDQLHFLTVEVEWVETKQVKGEDGSEETVRETTERTVFKQVKVSPEEAARLRPAEATPQAEATPDSEAGPEAAPDPSNDTDVDTEEDPTDARS